MDVVEGNDGDCDGNKSCLLPNDVSLSFNPLKRFTCYALHRCVLTRDRLCEATLKVALKVAMKIRVMAYRLGTQLVTQVTQLAMRQIMFQVVFDYN